MTYESETSGLQYGEEEEDDASSARRGVNDDSNDGPDDDGTSSPGTRNANHGWDGDEQELSLPSRSSELRFETQRENWKFMFGNVDDAGDLDEEYLDQDAKELLSALADQLGPSLVDLELSTKRKTGLQAEEEQADYGKKAENAVDYEDIQEEYEGPEVQVPARDEHFYAQAALAVPYRKAGSFVHEEDNYDEDDENDDDDDARDDKPALSVADAALPPASDVPVVLPSVEKDILTSEANVTCIEVVDGTAVETDPSQEEPPVAKLHQQDAIKIELPVLCEEAGKEVLRFSELFGVKEPYWVLGGRKGRQKRHIPKDKIETAEVEAEDLEDDEEEILKFCCDRNLTGKNLPHLKLEKDENSVVDGDEGSIIEESGSDASSVSWKERKSHLRRKKHEFCPAQPMKTTFDAWDDIAKWRDSIPAANFVAVHQQEWEADIVWDSVDSHKGSRSGVLGMSEDQSAFVIELDSDVEQDICTSQKENVFSNLERQDAVSPEVTSIPFQTRPTLLETLSRLPLESELVSKNISIQRHPQMLRLDSLSCVTSSNDDEMGLGMGQGNRLSKLSTACNQRNRDLACGSWLDNILWSLEGPTTDHEQQASKIIYDLQDGEMVFEIPNNKKGQLLRVHASAVILSASGTKDPGENGEVLLPAPSSLGRFNISNDKYYTNKKTQHQQKSNAKKRAVHGVKVMHSLPSIKLQTMKPKLTNKDLANFHRPKAVWYPHHNEVAAKEQGKLAVKGPMKVILKTLGGKGSKLSVDASETMEVLRAKAAKKLGGTF